MQIVAVPTPPPVDPSESAFGLLVRWLQLGEVERRAFLAMVDEINASSALIETSMLDLCARFRDLAGAATAQTARVERVAEIARTVDLHGKAIPIAEATGLVAEALREAIEGLRAASSQAATTVTALESMDRDVRDAEDCVKRIETINTKARFVALNAMIEANRAEGSPGAFQVIANEIKELSQETNSTSALVRDKIASIAVAVRTARQQLRSIAATDHSERDALNARLLAVLDGLTLQNRSLTDVLQEAVAASGDIDRTVSRLITGAQFQDRATQQLSHVSNAIEVLADISAGLRRETQAAVPGLDGDTEIESGMIDRLLGGQTLSAVRRRFFQRLGDDAAPHVAEVDAGGDIELF